MYNKSRILTASYTVLLLRVHIRIQIILNFISKKKIISFYKVLT